MRLKFGMCMAFAACAGEFLLSGCSSDECVENKSALPYAGFYESSSTTKPVSLSLGSLTVYGIEAPGDSLLADGKSSISSIYLPFRIDADTTRFVFRYGELEEENHVQADTVTFVYGREPRFVSAACGVSYIYNIKEIEHTGLLIDSVKCVGMQITNANRENIQIYFHVEDE